ncbi:flavodoxin family protein [Bullifex porci]|uniref:flavodoxin family protein n=1 Tax=Bullifex porci TaxID=2606638 RepID=UPI0023F04297|nr:flavodoxin family protein [Bullifex porci]MDD7256322.1 flavodoxin family protein [Bullifex porci]MDY2740887.1 flavodoxin family protein [Bullifex porci]
MNVLLLNGSPNAKGCTYTALKEVKDTLEQEGIEAQIVNIAIEYFTKEDVERVAELCVNADGLVIGSPVWYASSCGLSNYFLDLLFSRIGSKMRLKFGAAVVSCRRGGASSTFDQLNKYFTISQMPIVSSNYWNQVHGNTPDEVKQDLEGLQTMRILARNMAYLIKAVKSSNVALPDSEAKIKTNFIR